MQQQTGGMVLILLAVCLMGTVMCACAFCHALCDALCDALRAVQCGGDPKTQVVRLQVSLCGAVLLPVAAVIWAVYYLGLSV